MKGLLSWVTYASDNRDGVKALILAKSLRRTITTRNLTIFVSQDVSGEIRQLLENEFDRCILIDKAQLEKYSGLPFKTLALVNCWRLNKLKKFAFLDCNCMVVRNSDEIFHQTGRGTGGDQNDIKFISIIVDSPSDRKFKKLSELLKSSINNGGLQKMISLFPKRCLDKKYYVEILKTKKFLSNPMDINILYFSDAGKYYPVLESDSETNDLKKAVFKIWTELFTSIYTDDEISDRTVFEVKQEAIESIERNNINAIPPIDFQHLEELKHSVAIVGMSLRFPGANNPQEFWDLLINGKDGIIKVPENRWNEQQSLNVNENTKLTQAGFLKCPVDEIDGKFFGLSPAELSYLDPQQRITLQVMWESLENSGINPNSLKQSNTGVFGGWWRTDYKEMLEHSGIEEQEFFRTYMGNSLGTLTARISHILELTGPSISTESGCSTSLVAVDMACKSLLNEDCDIGLAFGVNLLLHPFDNNAMNFVVAKDGHCKTFDAKADGFGRAEGCAVLVLKRFPDAVRDGDTIHALIRGSAVVQEGPSRSMGTPTKKCEALAMELALEEAGVEPKDVSFVETHGTGTVLGDPLEVAAITEVYSKEREEPLIIGSVKTNIGHTESCSGIAGIIKTVLSLQNEVIPPHRNFETLNPEIDLDKIPAKIPLTPCKWEKRSDGQPRIAGVSSFGITGTDGHVILQETPDYPASGLAVVLGNPMNIIKISAKTKEALDEMMSVYKTFISQTTEDLDSISYTANIGRGDFQFRTTIVGKDKREILEKFEKKTFETKQIETENPKICFLFTGQGSQYPGMAKSLYDNCPTFQMHFDQCQGILSQNFNISVKEAMWGEEGSNLSRTIYSQTSIFCVEYCLLKLWESWGVIPDAVMGHSLGEFAAAVAANVLTLNDALTLVAERSRLIDSLPQGKMLVVKESQEKVEELLKNAFPNKNDRLDFAAINSPEQTVLAGSENLVRHFAEFCENNQIKTHILQATHAFHSKHMDPILDEYRRIASSVKYQPPSCTYASGMDGKIVNSEEINADYWVRHTREPVRFTSACQAALENGNTLFLEIGPQPVLSALVMINSDNLSVNAVCLPSLRKNDEEWTTMLTTLGKLYMHGVNINWKNHYQYSKVRKVTLPNYPFQNKSHWFDIKSDRPRSIHPLVGTSVANPSQMKLFQNNLDLSQLSFLKDHVIGNTTIFPGAGFLEMCMVTGHAASQCLDGNYVPPVAPFTIEDFNIEAPLALTETEKTQLQVTVSPGDNGEPKITIYSKLILDKETQKWIRHASASFCPYAVQWEGQEGFLNDTLQNIQSRCIVKADTKRNEYYDKFQALGLKFGPTFTTLDQGWKDSRETETFFSVIITCTSNSYICHPVIIDAMFQAVMISINPDAEKIHVPISVSKFIWYSKIETDKCYVHCRYGIGSLDKEYIATLYDSNGQRLAVMIGTTFMETTVSTIMSVIESQRTSLPMMYQETWREQLGPFDRRVPTNVQVDNLFSHEFKASLGPINEFNEDEQKFYDNTNRLIFLYMAKALLDLGWTQFNKVGQTFLLKDLLTQLKIQPEFKEFVHYMLKECVTEGYILIKSSETKNNILNAEFKVSKTLPPKNAISSEIESLYVSLKPSVNLEIEAYSATGKRLADILSGNQSPLSILFPEDSNKLSPAETIYQQSEMSRRETHTYGKVFPTLLNEIKNSCEKEEVTPIIRILEVGGGTASLTKLLLPYLNENPYNYEYTFTDISQTFFTYGEKAFAENTDPQRKGKVLFKTFNLENDPLSQGFIPHHYDIICAQNVVHATKDLRQSVQNLRNVLRPGGMLLMTELTEPMRGIRLSFGVLDGFWRFIDHDLRPDGCELNSRKWEILLKEQGFSRAIAFDGNKNHNAMIFAQGSTSSTYKPVKGTETEAENYSWMIFSDELGQSNFFRRKLSEMGKKSVVIRRSTEFTTQLDSELSEITIRPEVSSDMQQAFDQILQHSEKSSRLEGIIFLWAMQNDPNDGNYENLCKPFLAFSKILVNFDYSTKIYNFSRGLVHVGDHEQALPAASTMVAMARVLKNENPTLQMRCIDLEPIGSINEAMNEGWSELFIDDNEQSIVYRNNRRNILRASHLKLPNTSLAIPKSERFHLVLPQSNAISDLRFGSIAEKPTLSENEVEIRVKAFSLNFRDLLVVLKPSSEFEKWSTVGSDYAGVVTAIGSNVTLFKVGDTAFGANLTNTALPSHVVTKEDLILSIPENMTFAEASTLPIVANTVYLCLVKVAKLKEGETILIHTGSGGVGLCAIQLAKSLNCNIITTVGSARKRAYLKSLGVEHIFHSRNTNYEHDIRRITGGRGVDVVLNSLTSPGFKEASLAVCKEGARFIEMSKLNIWSKEEVQTLRPDVFYEVVDLSSAPDSKFKEYFKEIQKQVESSVIKPLPYVRFDASDIREALTYMQKAKHVGKIVCVMPEEAKGPASEMKIRMFNDRSTYMITGGLGGIGMEVAKWMAESGAKHIALIGRRPPTEKATEDIQRLQANGVNVIVKLMDIGNFEDCQDLLASLESENLPPLRGIMHAAGVLSDASIANQTWENMETVFNGKIRGGWNLHKLTLGYNLEHFVMFSSGTVNIGTAGQCNYVAANAFLDSLAHFRYSIGLPATTINWGQWGQVGIAANMEIMFLKPITPLQGISALDILMRKQRLQTSVVETNLHIITKVFPVTKKYYEEMLDGQTDKVEGLQLNSDGFWKEYDSTEDKEAKYQIVAKYIRSLIRQVLKLDENDVIDENTNLQDMGMDSLMMIEMKNFLQSLVGERAKITVNAVKDCNTVRKLGDRIVQLVSGVEDLPPPTQDELLQLIREDAELAPEIKPNDQPNCKVSEMKTILITGVTGNFGPYILRELSKRTHIDKIYCLMRTSSNAKVPMKERLLRLIEEKGLTSEIRFEILECVAGNVWKDKFGLSGDVYSNLCSEVDGIFHLAVKPGILEFYRKTSPSDDDVRTVNVLGTKEVLKFACLNKTKYLFHASTTIAVSTLGKDGRLSEDWPEVHDFDDFPNSAYPFSKFICDLLVAEAVRRGLPCKAFRFPFIGGDSRTGKNVTATNNHLLLRMMAYMQLGIMPAVCIPFMIVPVDVCADISTRLFLNDDTGFEIYNVSNPNSNDEQELEDISEEFGYSVETVEPDEFIEKVNQAKDSELYVFVKKGLENHKVWLKRLEEDIPTPAKAWITNRSEVFLSKKLVNLVPEYPECMETSLDILRRDLREAKESGIFKKLGLN